MNCGEKCDNYCYVGEGDFVCLLTHKLVMEDFCPTEHFGCCNYDWKAEKEKQTVVKEFAKELCYRLAYMENTIIGGKVYTQNKDFIERLNLLLKEMGIE